MLLVIGLGLLAWPGTARDISVGDTVFDYEVVTLDTSFGAPDSYTYLARYTDDDVTRGQITSIPVFDRSGTKTLDLTEVDMQGNYGTYFPVYATGADPTRWISIREPRISLDAVLDASKTDSINGKTVTTNTAIAFKLVAPEVGAYLMDQASVSVEVTLPDGAKVTRLGSVDLSNVRINRSTMYLSIPVEDVRTLEEGTYPAQAKWASPQGFADYAADSNTVWFTVASKDLSIEANKESAVRSKSFVVTISGDPKANYYLYIRDAGIMADHYPYIKQGQPGVVSMDGVSFTGASDADADALANSQRAKADGTAAVVTTKADGTRSIEFGTNTSTSDMTYTIKVVDPTDASRYDEVRVKVEKGEVTIAAEGDGTYVFGEEIKLSGTSTSSEKVYLFMTGPSLGDQNGVKLDNISAYAANGQYVKRDVASDDTWEYTWDTWRFFEKDTRAIPSAGTYTIYAVSAGKDEMGNNVDRSHLSGVEYSTYSLVLRYPSLSLNKVAHVIAKGDMLTVSGTATGTTDCVRLWIFGMNYRLFGANVPVEDGGVFRYTLDREDTQNLASGQYFVVAQHPIADGVFNVFPTTPGSATDFRIANDWSSDIVDLGNLSASAAATALTEMLDSPNCADSYRKASFFTEDAWVRIDSIGNWTVGDRFTITGTTNLAVGDDVCIDVTAASFKPTEKTDYDVFSGTSGRVKVVEGDGDNRWSFDIDTEQFRPDEYTVIVESVETGAIHRVTFTLEGDSYLPLDPSIGNYRVPSLYSSPHPDAIVAGGSVLLEGVLNLKDTDATTFPEGDSLELYTDLEDPTWRYTLLVDGDDSGSRTVSAHDLRIRGWDLSYQAGTTVRIWIGLNGTASETSPAQDQTLLRIRQMDSNGTPLAGSEYLIHFTPSTAVPPATSTLPLSAGWNFVSVPRPLAPGSDTAAIFASVDTADHSVLRYDTASGAWSALKADDPIRPLEGYWIYSVRNTAVPLTLSTTSPQAPPERALKAGWSAIGFSDTKPAAARDALLSLRDRWATLIGFDGENQQYETSVIRGGSGDHSDTREMLPTRGYWLYMTEDGTLAAIGA